jgi:hypothetical protein
MTMLDLLIAKTQRNITYAYWALFSSALLALFCLPRPLDDSTKTLLITLLSVLGTLITQQNSFWFARHRPGGIPDPQATTTTTTGDLRETTTTVAPAAPPSS